MIIHIEISVYTNLFNICFRKINRINLRENVSICIYIYIYISENKCKKIIHFFFVLFFVVSRFARLRCSKKFISCSSIRHFSSHLSFWSLYCFLIFVNCSFILNNKNSKNLRKNKNNLFINYLFFGFF